MLDYADIITLYIIILFVFAIISVFNIVYLLDRRCGIKTILLSGCILFCMFCSISIIGAVHIYNWEFEYKEYDILSLDLQNNIDGSFFLGSGNINEETYYYFYYQDEIGVKLSKIKSNGVYLCETNDIEPSIWQFKDVGFFNAYTIIYIPIDSIIMDYNPNF